MILAIHPTGKGFAYTLIQGEKSVVVFARSKPNNHTLDRMMKRVRRLISYYEPTALVLPEYDRRRQTPRGELLMNACEDHAKKVGIEVKRYSYDDVKIAFLPYKANTRFEIAHALATTFPELQQKLPAYRNNCDNEPYNMPIFSALALAMTHLYMT